MMRRYFYSAAILISILPAFSQSQSEENRAPEIKVIEPAENSSFRWNTVIPYTIQVTDYEDGNSDYDEINPREVLLILKFLKDSSGLEPYLIKESQTNYLPLVQMARSTCFNCHRAREKLIGPSFDLLAEKYKGDPKTVETLAEKIRKGSSANWGDEKMPPHPDLTLEEAKAMVRWILYNNSDPSKNYLAGIEGAIPTAKQEVSGSEHAILVVRASYTDHGTKNHPQNRKQAQKTIILKGK